jgi:putative hydrolase of the HAD superfamily
MPPLIEGIDPDRVEAAVFDLGGVFIGGGVESVQAFGDRHGLSRAAWDAIRRELFDAAGLWSAVERGGATFAEFVTHLRARAREHGADVSLADAENFMGNMRGTPTDRLRPEIVAATARLHTRMPTALLTNNIPEWRDGWRSLFDVDALFDVVIDSCEVGMRKPEPEIYELTRAKLGLPHTALFFVRARTLGSPRARRGQARTTTTLTRHRGRRREVGDLQ